MPLVPIRELDDPRLAPYRNLKQTNDSARHGRFIAEGDKLVRRMLESGLPVDSVLLGESYVAAFRDDLPPELPALVVPDALVEAVVGFNFHRGILGCGRRRSPPTTLAEILLAADRPCRLVVCPDVQDPENLGAIIRLAAGFAVDGMVIGPRCADPFSRRVQRVSMGTVYRLPLAHTPDVPSVLAELRTRYAVESWATVLAPDAEPLSRAPRRSRLALVFGSEGHGLEADVVAACDRRVTIPMPAHVDSFNVAVATGIFLYEVTRQPN